MVAFAPSVFIPPAQAPAQAPSELGRQPGHGLMPIVVSLSGGLTSAYMLRLLLDNYASHPFHVVFANTGRELKATRDFVREIGLRWGVKITWLEAVIHSEKGQGTTYREVTPENCARPEYELERPVGRPADWEHPFEAGLAKYGISNESFPWCSRELKGVILDKWAKDQVGDGDVWFKHAIGYRADEEHRSRRDKFFYPLHHWGVTKAQVEAWWAKQPFTLGLKNYQGNCDLCWKKSLRKTLLILAENPCIANWWDQQEQAFGTMPEGHVREKNNQVFLHDERSTQRLVQMMEGDLFYTVMNRPFPSGVDAELTCPCGS